MHITDKTDGSTHAIFRGCVEVKVRYDWMKRMDVETLHCKY